MKACLRFAPMLGSREGELPAEEARALEAHLAECAPCRALAAEVAATEGLLAEGLLAKANERDFGPFVDEVMARVERGGKGFNRAYPLAPRPRRAGLASGVLAALGARWKLAASTAFAVLAAVSVFMYVHRDVTEHEELAVLELDVQGGSTLLQTSDGPVVLLEPDDSGS